MNLPLDGKSTHGCRFHVRGYYGIDTVTIASRVSRLAAEGALKAWRREREARDLSANWGWTFWIEEGEA
jgi:hypothetical protein